MLATISTSTPWAAAGNVLSIRTWMDERVAALDFDLRDTGLRLRPEWRLPALVYSLALQQILPEALAILPHAETSVPPSRMPAAATADGHCETGVAESAYLAGICDAASA